MGTKRERFEKELSGAIMHYLHSNDEETANKIAFEAITDILQKIDDIDKNSSMVDKQEDVDKERAIRLISIKETGYQLNIIGWGGWDSNCLIKQDKVLVQCKYNVIKNDKEDKTLLFNFGVRYVEKGNPDNVYLECCYCFEFELGEEIKSYIYQKNDNEGIYIVDKALLTCVGSVAIGTMRGIIAEKTRGTVLTQILVPIMDAEKIAEFFLKEQKDKGLTPKNKEE